MADNQQQTDLNDPVAASFLRTHGSPAGLDDDDPVAASFRRTHSGGIGAPTPASAPSQPPISDDSNDPVAASFRRTHPNTEQQQQQSSSGDNEAERMGEGQSWVTRPLQTYAGFGEYRKGAGPIERGVEKFGSGLLSPLSLGLMVVTGGLGGLAEAGAATAGEEVATSLAGRAGQAVLSKLAPEVAAKVATASGVVSKLANAGFTGQQIYSLAKDSPQLKDAIAAGDYDKAQELGISMLLNGTLAGLSTYHLMRSVNKSGEPTWTKDKEVLAASQQPVTQAGADALKFRKANETLIKNAPLDMAGLLYHEAGGDGATLEKWRQEIVDDNNIKPAIQQKYDALLKQAQSLPPEVQKLSAELRLEYAKDLAELKANGKFHPNSPGAPNYAGQHKYVPDDEGMSAVKGPGSSMRRLTKSPDFTKSRSFDTIVDAIKAGYEPKDIGLAGAREEYIRQFGGMRGAINAENEGMSQTAEDNRPLFIDPARVRDIDGKKVIAVEPGTDVGDIGERRVDAENRKRIDEMSPEDRKRELDTLRPPPPIKVGPPAPMGEAKSRDLRPEDFLRRVAGTADPAAVKAAVLKEGVDDLHIQNLRDTYKAGAKVEPVEVNIDKSGNVIDATGMHRAYAALQAGIEKVPVVMRRINEERAPNVDPTPGRWPTGLDPITDKEIVGKAIAEITGSGAIKFDDLSSYPKTRARVIKRALDMKVDEKTANATGPTAARKPSLSTSGEAKIIIKNGKLYYDVSDYKPGPDVFAKHRFKATDKYGDPVFEKANALIHPDYHEQVTQAFQDSSWFRKNPIMKVALSASTQAKKSLLSFSPFHFTTEYLRGVQMGLSPLEALRPGELTPDRLAVKAKFGPSLSVANQRSLAAEGAAGNTPLINKIPGVGKFLANNEERLFGGGGYIDRLKADSFDKVTKQIASRNSNWTPDQVQFASSKIVDAAFGGLNWKMLGASMNSVDALRLIALAPDFTGSQILFAKYGLQPGGSVVGQSLMRIALYNFGVSRVLNMLTTGKLHLEHPFGVVSPDEKKTYSIRTMPEDIAHALTDPRGFVYNRLNPLLVRTAVEGLTGKDERGKSVTYEKELHDLLRNVLPISGQNIIPTFRREDEGVGTSVLRGMGVASEPNTTSAFKLAGKLASDRSESGPLDQNKLERHQFVMQMEDSLRNGTIKPQALNEAIQHETLSRDEAKEIWTNFKETQQGADGKPMNEYTARLYTRATRLPMKNFLEVYDIATPQERKVLLPLLEKKGKAYLKKAQSSMVSTQREQDPTYQRLWRDIGHVPLW